MKALTVRQPWASLIAVGVKTIETRSWRTEYRGPLAIHAGQHRPVEGEEVGGWWWGWDFDHGVIVNQNAYPRFEEYPAPLGAVVAVANLVDCVPIEVVLPKADVAPGTRQYKASHDRVTIHPLAPAAPAFRWENGGGHDVAAQLAFGDFTPGRWAWLLGDVRPLPEPMKVKGAQGLWIVPAATAGFLSAVTS